MRQLLLCLLLGISISYSQDITLQSKSINNGNSIAVEFKLTNNGSSDINLQNYEIEYFINEPEGVAGNLIDLSEPNVIQIQIDNLVVNLSSQASTGVNGTYTVIDAISTGGKSANVKLSFLFGAGLPVLSTGKSATVNAHFYKNGWQYQFTETDDWSYQSSTLSVNPNVVLRDGQTVIRGTEPVVNQVPTDIAFSGTSIAENSAINTVVGILTTTDDQTEGHTYSLVSGGDKFKIQGSDLLVNGELDYETNASHSITVKVTDQYGAEFQKIFTVSVTDIDPEYQYPEYTGANEDMKIEGISRFMNPAKSNINGTVIDGNNLVLTNDITILESDVNPNVRYFENPSTEFSNGHLKFVEYKTNGSQSGRTEVSSGISQTKVYTDSADVNIVLTDKIEIDGSLNNLPTFIITKNKATYKNNVSDPDKYFNNPTTEVGNGLIKSIEYRTAETGGRKPYSSVITPSRLTTDTADVKVLEADTIAPNIVKLKNTINVDEHYSIKAVGDSLKLEYKKGGGLASRLTYFTPAYIEVAKKDVNGQTSRTDIDGGNINTSSVSAVNFSSTTGHGNWLDLNTTNGKRWMIHNPASQDKLEIGHNNGTSDKWDYLAIHENGYVGIGTTAPESKLHVNGTITADKFKIGDWVLETPDYVFEDDYKLRSLEEVERHIKERKHLPEVPSAADMKRDGVEIASLNMALLKKIEELTLYMIEQKKENKEQGELIKKLVNRIEKLEK